MQSDDTTQTTEGEEPRGEIVEAIRHGEITRGHPHAPKTPPGAPMTLFGSTNPVEVIEAATETAEALTEILEKRQLYKDIRDRRHVLVEGWTLLGSLLGVFPTTIWTHQVTDPDGAWRPPEFHEEERQLHSKWCDRGPSGHQMRDGCKTYTKTVQVIDRAGSGGWEARVEAHTLAGDIVGSAEAECRWDEWSWRDRDSHALRSMAQTRATAKALRMPLGFIVELAGFSATPAEEMPSGSDPGTEAITEPDEPALEHKPGHPVWDNRGDERTTPKTDGGKGWPVFKCKLNDCTDGRDGRPWASWDPHQFSSPEVRAKREMVKLVEKHEKGWEIYYPREAPDYTKEFGELVAAAHDEGGPAQKAGILWGRLFDVASGGMLFEYEEEGRPNQRDLNIIVRAAEIALAQAEEDAADIILELDAIERAIEQTLEEEADANVGMSDYS